MKTAILLFALALSAGDGDPILTKKGIALGGYDPVAYFTLGSPVQGSSAITAEHRGAVFQFANNTHRKTFLEDPEKYVPQYGGWCAYAMANGKFYKTDPEAWAVEDGKLYLNYDKGVQKKWEKDVSGFITKADAQWPEVKHKKQ